jgi:predicted RNA-binding Zn-ribbon protein involved in translation (DUF1610 family)
MRVGHGDISVSPIGLIEPKRKAGFKTKLLVLLIMVLILSSGSLYYIESPIFYYGFLGFSVFIILLIAYFLMFVTEPRAELFTEDEPDSSSGVSDDAIQNPGLEKVLKAEKKYQRKQTKSRGTSKRMTKPKTTRTLKKKPDAAYLGEHELKRSEVEEAEDKPKEKVEIKKISWKKQKEKASTKRRKRIGSMPLDESAYEERVRLQKKSDKDGKPETEKKITTFLCPDCGGKELYYEAGLISGYKYHCKDCDYIGTFVIEKDFKVK